MHEVATTILHQLGGRRFLAMTGAKGLIGSDRVLGFKLPRAKDGINYVRVFLNANDTYNIQFRRVTTNFQSAARHGDRIIRELDGVYADDLQRLFTEATGLYTHL